MKVLTLVQVNQSGQEQHFANQFSKNMDLTLILKKNGGVVHMVSYKESVALNERWTS